MSMDTDEKIIVFFLSCLATFLIFIAIVLSVSLYITAKHEDRELTIREREIELKAEQYPYKSETKLEITHD